MCFSIKQYTSTYPSVCDDVACDTKSDKARVDSMLNSSEEVQHLSVALDDKQPGTDCKPRVLLTSQFYSICHINSDWQVRSRLGLPGDKK